MKSFLNYSKNRFLYGLFKFGFLLLALYLGYSLFGCINVFAATTVNGTMAWTNTAIYNNSTNSTLLEHNCPNQYSYVNNMCSFNLLYPEQSTAQNLEYRFGFSDPDTRPFNFTANTDYKISFKVTGALNYSKLYFNYSNWSSGSYSSNVTPKNVSYSNGTLTVTFSFSSNVSVNAFFFYIPLITNGVPGENHTYSVAQAFSIYDATQVSDVIIDQNQVIIDQNKETNEKLDDLNDKQEQSNQIQTDIKDSLTDTTPPDLNGLSDSAGWLPAGPVDSILNLPISLLNNLNDNLGGTCQPAVLTLPYVNKDITLPCMSSIYEKLGITIWVNSVGTIAAAFIAYYYLLELYKWVDNVLTMRENTWNDVDQWGGI